MFANGATIVDVGGESTRPGAEPVDQQEELRRTIPVVEALAQFGRVSIDTSKPVVARTAVAHGASIINDVTSRLCEVAGETGAGYVAMHMQGVPRTMQLEPRYKNVVGEVEDFLAAVTARARSAGVVDCWVDPGIGFGKTLEQNILLFRSIPVFRRIAPVLVGISRKRVLGDITGRRDPADRLSASLAAACLATEIGVDVLRVHDVQETSDVLKTYGALAGDGPAGPARLSSDFRSVPDHAADRHRLGER